MERQWSFPAAPGCVSELRSAVCAFAGEEGVADPPLADVRLAVSEAVTNAVLHGYRADCEPGDVEVSATVLDDRLEVVVCDRGTGFKARSDSPGAGLGIAIMVAVTDSFAIRDGRPQGTEVHLGFDLR